VVSPPDTHTATSDAIQHTAHLSGNSAPSVAASASRSCCSLLHMFSPSRASLSSAAVQPRIASTRGQYCRLTVHCSCAAPALLL
jgi:hypothetical protein